MGKLLSTNTRVYVYPALAEGRLVTLEGVTVSDDQSGLLTYLIDNKFLLAIEVCNESHLSMTSKNTRILIFTGEGLAKLCSV